ncbi:orotate phosphoribosyltransferase [Natronincola ferrireducens]|uniref:Orotate phosphoribosyltransferase n=1 Tax=Natronincola ferrireducens TaxID=393762 RepID=A0A1G9G036_9FIRM|nr:orotate phosphoribosyltransferase [Natronincola ferrireducens]SDK93989.1 orotate phosphoribosyltransferase [Natronincola ferrireducens]
MIKKERVLEIFEKLEVLKRGHFLFTSGRHSDNYMQCAKILQYPEYTEEIIKGLAEEFQGDKIDMVIGPALGGITMSYEFARQLKTISLFTERENNQMTLRRGFTIPKDSKVLVVEDVITTGGSVKEVIEIVKQQGGKVVGIAALVDRTGGEIDFGIKFRTAFSEKLTSHEPEDCPLCKEGNIPLEKPGSRKF